MTIDEGGGPANDNPGPPSPPAEGVHVVEVSEGNVTEAILGADGGISIEPVAGEDHSPPDEPANDNPEPPDGAA